MQGDWLWNQTPEPMGVWGNIKMLSRSDKTDFLLLYNFNTFPHQTTLTLPWWKAWRRSKRKVLQIRQQQEEETRSLLSKVPRERIIFLLREPPLDKVVELHKTFYQAAQEYCGYVSGPDDFAPIPDYMPVIWYHSGSFRELNEMPPPKKTHRCSWITSGISRTVNHIKKLEFLKLLVESDLELDVYGKNWLDKQLRAN